MITLTLPILLYFFLDRKRKIQSIFKTIMIRKKIELKCYSQINVKILMYLKSISKIMIFPASYSRKVNRRKY